MPILEYLTNNDFEFIDRVGYSTNTQVSRTVCFKRLMGRNSSSGLVTYFKEGTVSYKLKNIELGTKKTNERKARRVSLNELDERITATFG